ncbi:MAG: efflux RND transporter periplasmic adaptor subunit, partial [Bacteroidota bacterium]
PYIFLTCLISLGVFSCSSPEEEQKAESVKYVKVERVNGGQSKERLVFNGSINEKSLTSLSFRVGGPLVKLNFKAGDQVSAGAVIAKIDNRDYLLNVQSTKAQYEQLEGEYARYKALHLKKKIPANSFEKVESGYLMAKTAYENAVNQLNDTELRSPATGYIHEKFTENFQTVTSGQPIVSIIDLSSMEVVVSVAESQLLKLKECNENYLSVKNANISKLPVKILSVGEKTKDDGLFEVKFSLENENNLGIYPGMSAEVTVLCNSENNIVNISSGAVFHQNSQDFVWVYDDQAKIINKRKVEVKRIASGGKIELKSGLESGEVIVSAGVYYLQDQQPVQPIQQLSKTNIGGLL